jgi:signal transduction histidine kinase
MRLLQGRVHRMEALIDGILTYSRAGRRLTPPEPVETGALVRDVIELLAPPAEVRIQMPDQFPTIEAERVPLQQVFMNL